MSFAAGALSAVQTLSFSVELHSAPATGGTSPYTYQWYRGSASNFTPGGGNILTGKTALDIIDDTVLPGVQYYYKVVATDTGHSNDTATSSALSVLTQTGTQSQNKFSQSPIQGQLDLRFNGDSLSVQIDNGVSGSVVASQAMKFTADANGIPTVTPCTADTDIVAGFINYSVKDQSFVALDTAEMSMDGNVMYLVSTAAFDRGTKLMIDATVVGGVLTATTGKPVCGFAIDTASAAGQLVRVKLTTPAFMVA